MCRPTTRSDGYKQTGWETDISPEVKSGTSRRGGGVGGGPGRGGLWQKAIEHL